MSDRSGLMMATLRQSDKCISKLTLFSGISAELTKIFQQWTVFAIATFQICPQIYLKLHPVINPIITIEWKRDRFGVGKCITLNLKYGKSQHSNRSSDSPF